MTSSYYKRTSIKKKGCSAFIPVPAALIKRGRLSLNQKVEFIIESNKLRIQPLSQTQERNLAQFLSKLKQMLAQTQQHVGLEK